MTRGDALSGLLGGVLIGAAAGTLLLFNGDIMGASGIATSVSLNPVKAMSDSSQHWKFVFLASFLLTSNIASIAFVPEAPALSSLGYLIAGGLTGIGTRLGNGCTSGHGICGLARFSKRSLVAVLTFMATGAATTVATKGMFPPSKQESSAERMGPIGTALGLVAFGAAVTAAWFNKAPKEQKAKHIPAAVSGALFAKGLQISGMANTSKVWGFLDVTLIPEGAWNPQLAMVMGGGVIVSFLTYQFVPDFAIFGSKSAMSCPLTQPKDKGFSHLPRSKAIDFYLVAGAALFGMGWGLGGKHRTVELNLVVRVKWTLPVIYCYFVSAKFLTRSTLPSCHLCSFPGMCPGPALFLAGSGAPYALTQWMPGIWIGSLLATWYKNKQHIPNNNGTD